MEELDKLTPTELLKIGNDIKSKHEILKNRIIDYTILIEDLQKKINECVAEMDSIEEKYVKIIEIIENYDVW